jgi:nucleoside-diphosphate-sugar epimerase
MGSTRKKNTTKMKLKGKRILVTGGTGFIGGRLVEKLILEHNAQVRVLVRDFSRASRIARFNLQIIAGDISDESAIDEATKGCEVVFHCAYDFGGTRKQRERVNVGGTKNVAKAALRHGVRMVHVSTADVYGWPSGGTLNEMALKQVKGNIYAETKLAAEQLVLAYHQRYNLSVIVLQPTIVYGPFCRPWTITPVRQLMSGRVVLVDGGEGCCNAVYIDDVVDALLLAATKENAIGEAFLISGDETITWKEFYNAFETILGLSTTISMRSEEVEKSLIKNSYTNSTLQPIISLLRDSYIRTQLMQVSTVVKIRNIAREFLPASLLQYIKSKILGSEVETKRNNKSKLIEKPINIPDPWRLKLYRSNARVQIDKAKRILGYKPYFNFEHGMQLTSDFIRWANFLK